MPKPYQVKTKPIPGNRFRTVLPPARRILRSLAKRTRRQPYLRSVYFKKDKIFLTHYWSHLNQKPIPEQIRRLKLLPCALETIQKSQQIPTSKQDKINPRFIFHRFTATTPDSQIFHVQIREDLKTGRKELMSAFSSHKKSPA